MNANEAKVLTNHYKPIIIQKLIAEIFDKIEVAAKNGECEILIQKPKHSEVLNEIKKAGFIVSHISLEYLADHCEIKWN